MNTTDFIKAKDGRNTGLTVSLFGLGKSNSALLPKLKEKGYKIILRSNDPVYSDFPFDKVYTGADCFDEMNEDIVFLSPSVRRDIPELSAAKSRGTVLSSDCELFFSERIGKRFCITGSDGKSTTTALVAKMLEDTFKNSVYQVGNCGIPYASVPLEQESAYVAEMSSFNLMYTTPTCDRSVITNITENHLDWHSSFEEYIAAKANIIDLSDGAVLSADCKICRELGTKKDIFCYFSMTLSYEQLRHTLRAEHYITLEKGCISIDGRAITSKENLSGRKSYEILNVMAAAGAILGYTDTRVISDVCRTFPSLSHRCQLFHSFCGIDFIDSSIDTTPIRTASTLNALGKRVKIILGGRGKGLSLSPLTLPLCKYARKIAVYGEACQEISAFLHADPVLSKTEHECFTSFDDAFCYIINGLEPNDTVILSPAATAYGEFRNFEHRANHFQNLVKEHF